MENSNISPVADTASTTQAAPVNPVTEGEMSDFQQSASAFFGRIVSTVVSLSEQAKELVKLQQDVQRATDKLNALIEDNQRKAEEIQGLRETNAWLGRTSQANSERADKAEAELADAKAYNKMLEDDHATVVAKLTTQIEQDRKEREEWSQRWTDKVNSIEGRNSELAQRVRDLEAANAELQRDRDRAMQDAESIHLEMERVVRERDVARDKLAAIKSALEQSQTQLRAIG